MKTARVLAIGSFAFAILFVAGCKPDWPQCKNDDHCAERDGDVVNYVCVNGTCQECGADTDCEAGFICRENACVPKPECATDGDCSGNLVCRNEKCVPECTTNTDCASGMKCMQSRCVPEDACTTNADCAEGQECGAQGTCQAMACRPEPVHFAFDSFALDTEARGALEEAAQCLQQSESQVTLTGHADERGTEEYNLALAEKRANSVQKYLTTLGLQQSRLRTVSYGEERPVCEEATEDCWARNRRVEFEVQRPGM